MFLHVCCIWKDLKQSLMIFSGLVNDTQLFSVTISKVSKCIMSSVLKSVQIVKVMLYNPVLRYGNISKISAQLCGQKRVHCLVNTSVKVTFKSISLLLIKQQIQLTNLELKAKSRGGRYDQNCVSRYD